MEAEKKRRHPPGEHALLSSERVSRGEKFQPLCAWRRQPDSHDSTRPLRFSRVDPINSAHFFGAQHSPFSHYHNPIHRRPSLSPPIINPSYAHPFYPPFYICVEVVPLSPSHPQTPYRWGVKRTFATLSSDHTLSACSTSKRLRP